MDASPSPAPAPSPSGGVSPLGGRRPSATVPNRPVRALGVLSALGQRLARLRLVDGVVVLGLLAGAAVLASFVLDYSLDLPVGVRAVFLLAGGIAALVFAWRRLVAPLSRRTRERDLALLVEEAHPELRQSLITAIDLTAEGSVSARHVSPELVAAVVEDVEAGVASISFDRVFRLEGLFRRSGFLVALGVVTIVGVVVAPQLASIWFRRNVLLAADRWPKGTILDAPVLPTAVAMGDDLVISVRVLRGAPKVVEVERVIGGEVRRSSMDLREAASWDLRASGGGGTPGAVAELRSRGFIDASGEPISRRLERLGRGEAEEIAALFRAAEYDVELDGHDEFVHEFRNISEPLRFWVQGGDDRIGPFEVDVRTRPRIDMSSVRVSYRLPEYTGARPEDDEIVQAHGNLRVPVGTRVHYAMATNIPVERAFIVLRQDIDTDGGRPDAEDQWPHPGATALDLERGQRFAGEFVVRSSGSYYFLFEEAHGFRSEKPERFRIHAIPDQKPRVRIVEPERVSEEVTPTATVPIRVRIEDDYGLRRASIEGGYFAPGSDERVVQSIALPLPAPGAPETGLARSGEGDDGKEIEVELLLDIATLRTGGDAPPAPGGRFEFFAFAEDTGITEAIDESTGRPFGNIGESRVHLLEIVDPDELERLVTTWLMVVRDQLRQVLSRQEAVRRQFETFRDEVALEGGVGTSHLAELARHRQDQVKVGESLERQAREIERILSKMDANRFGDERMRRWVDRIRDEVDHLAGANSSELVAEIDAVREDAKSATQPAERLTEASVSQRQMERDIRRVIVQLENYGDKNTFIQLLKDVRRRQAEIRDLTRARAEGASGNEKE